MLDGDLLLQLPSGQGRVAHRVILALRAPGLLRAVRPRSGSQPLDVVPLDIGVLALEALLRYMHSDELTIDEDLPYEVRKEVAEQLQNVAKTFQIPRLSELTFFTLTHRGAVPVSTFVADFERAFDNPLCSDFRIRVADRVFRTHRCLLMARSAYFRIMLQSGMREATVGEMTVSEVSPECFEQVLRYLLTDECIIDPPEHAVELLSAANLFDLPRLRGICEATLEMHFDFSSLESVLALLALSEAHNAAHLQQLALYVVQNDFGIAAAKRCTEAWDCLSLELKRKLDRGLMLLK